MWISHAVHLDIFNENTKENHGYIFSFPSMIFILTHVLILIEVKSLSILTIILFFFRLTDVQQVVDNQQDRADSLISENFYETRE